MPAGGIAGQPIEDRAATWAQHEYAAEAFRQVVNVTRAGGVDVLPVKGIVLAHTLYDEVEERPMVDVDFRVRRQDLRRLASILRSAGWRVGVTSRQLGTMEIYTSRTLVEFESSIGPPGVCAVGVEDMMARATMRTTLGVDHLEPEVHDHALLLCVNAFKDKLVLAAPWAREDLYRIAVTPEFNSREFVARVAEAELATVVWIVADWLSTGSRDTVWTDVRNRLDEVRRRNYAALYMRLARRAPESVAIGVLARAASDSRALRLKAVALGVAGTLLETGRRVRRVFLNGAPRQGNEEGVSSLKSV
jgi:hypothetical protein